MREWWIGLSRRERIAVATAAAVVALALLFLGGVEPAWHARTRLSTDLPRLRSEAAEMDRLAAESKKLKLRTRTLESAEQTKSALLRSLSERGVAAPQIRDERGRFIVSAKRTDAAGWLAWLKDVTGDLPLRIASARMTRVAAGVVDAEVTLAPAGQK